MKNQPSRCPTAHRLPVLTGPVPREHGRQAARSKRDRSGEHANQETDLATTAPPQAAFLIP